MGYEMVEATGNMNMHQHLDNSIRFRLIEINKIKYYYIFECHGQETVSNTFGKDIASFNYFYKNLLVLSVASDGVSTVSFATVICAPVCITSTSLSLVFSILVMELQKHF